MAKQALPGAFAERYTLLASTNSAVAAAGDALQRDIYREHSIQVINPGGAMVHVEGSLDEAQGVTEPANWSPLVAASAAASVIHFINGRLRWIRARREATAGNVSVTVRILSGVGSR